MGDECQTEISCDACATCDRYGLSIDESTGKITGYGWSGNDAGKSELGWIDFSRTNYYSQAWLQTKFGDIYAQGDIGSASTPNPPTDKYNALYLISSAGTISSFRSQRGAVGCLPGDFNCYSGNPTSGVDVSEFIQQNYNPLYFPYASTDYTNILGRLDIDGLTEPIGATGMNKYGDVVESYGAEGQTTTLNQLGWCTGEGTQIFLEDPATHRTKVYHIKGDLNFTCGGSQTSLVISAAQPDHKGSGTIMVDGRLTVNMDMSYGSLGAYQKIDQLPSLGVIVKDYLVIGENANNVVGSYLVLGPWSGRSVTGIEIMNSVEETPFQAQGLFIAGTFKFGRTYRGTLLDPQPAEQIIYDGRVVANPPPGFRDFSKVLPKIRETVP